jgi:hypothetical protein
VVCYSGAMHLIHPNQIRKNKKLVCGFLLLLATVAVFAIAFSFRTTADKDKVYDLYTLQAAIENYYETHNDTLPSSLRGLDGLKLRGSDNDYAYNKSIDVFEFELCAIFKSKGIPLNPYGLEDYSDHSKGKNCYKLDVYATRLTKSKYGLGDYPKELQPQ